MLQFFGILLMNELLEFIVGASRFSLQLASQETDL